MVVVVVVVAAAAAAAAAQNVAVARGETEACGAEADGEGDEVVVVVAAAAAVGGDDGVDDADGTLRRPSWPYHGRSHNKLHPTLAYSTGLRRPTPPSCRPRCFRARLLQR